MMIKKNRKIVFVLCLILLVPLFLAVTTKTPENKPLVKGAKMTPSLNISVYNSDGILKATRLKEDDLLLDNFRNFFIAFFDSATSKTVDLKDTSNTARTIVVHKTSSTTTNTWSDSASGSTTKGGIMGIGSGTNAPTQTDYALQTIYGSLADVPNTYPTWDVATGNVTIQKSFAITGTITITEAVLGVRWIPSSGTTSYDIMMFRDTFTGISCVNGDTVVVTYKINLSVSYNRNFGILLSNIFYNVADAGTKQDTLYSITATPISMIFYYYTSATTGIFNCGGAYAVYIAHGTGSTAESRSHATLTTLTDSLSVITSITISGSDIVAVGDILCGANRALRENMIMSYYVNSAYQVMYIRTVYAQVDIVSGHSARHTLTFDW